MLKQGMTALKKAHIARILCMLFFVVCLISLSGCTAFEINSQGNEAVNAEKQTMSCWTCSYFELAFRVADSMSTSMVASIAKSALSLLAVGYGLWLAIYILKYVSAMHEPDVGAFWKGLAVQTFFVVLGTGMLGDLTSGSSSSVIKMIIDPIFTGFVDAGLMIINASGLSFSCPSQGSPNAGMVCLITALQGKLNTMVGISYMSVLLGPTVFIVLIGIGIYCVSIYMMLYFPVLLLDCVFRYCFLIALTPLMVVGYCFKSTRSFANKGGTMLVEIGLAIVGMCVFTAVTVEVVHKYIDTFLPFAKNPLFLLDDPAAFERVIYGPGMTGLIFVIIFLIYFADVILDLMKLFSGGVGGLGKTAAATYNGVKGIGQMAGKVAKFGVNRAMRKADMAAKNKKEALDAKVKKDGYDKLSDKEKKQLDAANEHLMDRGYLARDKDGHMSQGPGANLHATQAYDNLGKGGLRNFAAGVASDWNGSMMNDESRHDHSQNKVSDNYKGEVD